MSPGIVQDPALAATPRCSLPLLGLAQSDGSKEMTLRDQGYRGTASGSLYACGSMALDQFSARLPLGSTNCSWVLPCPVSSFRRSGNNSISKRTASVPQRPRG